MYNLFLILQLISTLEHLADTEDTTPGMLDDRKSDTLTPKVSQKSPKRSARSSARTEAKSTARRSPSPKGKKTRYNQEIKNVFSKLSYYLDG